MGGDGSIDGFTITCDGSIVDSVTIAGDISCIGSNGVIVAWVVMVVSMVLLLS